MDLFLAGSADGFPETTESIVWNGGGNVLVSYMHPAKTRAINKLMKLYLAGLGIRKEINCLVEFGYDRLLSFASNKDLADLTIARVNKLKEIIERDYEKFKKETDIYEIDKLKEELMDLYLVGPEKANIMAVASEELKSNMLFNYLDKSAIDKYKEMISSNGKLFIDSGAFSAWTQGKVINVDEYINWINERADFIDLYGQVDVIPGDRNSGRLPTIDEVNDAAKKTWDNYLYMRPKMKKPEGLLYTFHVGENIEFLKQALEWVDENGNHIPYIALGGMVGKPYETRRNFLDKCFDAIEHSSNPNVKTHAFGMTDKTLLTKYPITSADSTSWIMTGANGGIMTDAGIVFISSQRKTDPNHYSHLPKELQDEFNRTIAEFKFTLDELAESRDKRIMHNARFMRSRFARIEYNPGYRKKSLF